MITYFQAIIMGLAQGISELFPVSSLGHSVILPQLLRWQINQGDPFFVTFLVATHLATATVLFFFFWKDWLNIFLGLGRSLSQRRIDSDDAYAKLGWLLVVGTIPTGILGLLLQEKLQSLFASPQLAAIVLIFNGLMLYGAEVLRKKASHKNPHPDPLPSAAVRLRRTMADKKGEGDGRTDKRLAKLSWTQSVVVGTSQIISLIPGFSRSGSTMAGGLLAGLSNEDAARFSFLLATPIIGAAALLKIPELFLPQNHNVIGPAIIGALAAAIAAYFAVNFLVKFFHTNKLTPFAIYCAAAGIIYFLILHFA